MGEREYDWRYELFDYLPKRLVQARDRDDVMFANKQRADDHEAISGLTAYIEKLEVENDLLHRSLESIEERVSALFDAHEAISVAETVITSLRDHIRRVEAERDTAQKQARRVAIAAMRVMLKWDETAALYDIECACCPPHVEFIAAIEDIGFGNVTLVAAVREADEATQHQPSQDTTQESTQEAVTGDSTQDGQR